MASAAAENPELFSHMTLIEGPGVQTFVEIKQSNQGIRESLYKKMDIYNGLPNLINTHGSHPSSANIFSISAPKTNIDLKNGEFGIREQISFTKDTHLLGNLIQEVQKGNIQRSDISWYRNVIDSYKVQINQDDYSKASLVYKHTGEEIANGKSGVEQVKNGYFYKTDNPLITESHVREMVGEEVTIILDEDLLNPAAPRYFHIYNPKTVAHEQSSHFSSTFDKVGSAFSYSSGGYSGDMLNHFSNQVFGANAKVWNRNSDYGTAIEGRYNFMTSFNHGQHSSVYALSSNIYNPFKAYGSQSHFYNQHSSVVFNALRELDIMIWNAEQFL